MVELKLQQVLAELLELKVELRVNHKALLGVDEAASYLGLAPKSIRNCLGPRAPKPFPVRPVRVGGRVLFRRADLDAFVEALEPDTKQNPPGGPSHRGKRRSDDIYYKF
jgi:hypothetical protein